MSKYTVLAFVENKPGVLSKFSGLLRRKMYNIDSLTVCETDNDSISRMTITLTSDHIDNVVQMMKQIEKLPEVVTIKNLDPENSFWREVAIVKCKLMPSKLEYFKSNYGIEILSEKEEYITIQIAGTTMRIDAFLGEVTSKNIIEYARSGVTALEE